VIDQVLPDPVDALGIAQRDAGDRIDLEEVHHSHAESVAHVLKDLGSVGRDFVVLVESTVLVRDGGFRLNFSSLAVQLL
jgi:hypothetical protein